MDCFGALKQAIWARSLFDGHPDVGGMLTWQAGLTVVLGGKAMGRLRIFSKVVFRLEPRKGVKP